MVGTATSLLLLFLTPNSSILEQATQKETRPIRIAFSPWVGDAALVLARDEFKKNNVTGGTSSNGKRIKGGGVIP